MLEHLKKTLEDAMSELAKREAAVVETKKFINSLCVFSKQPPMFADLGEVSAVKKTTIERNAYYGQPLATCVGSYLEMRNTAGLVKEATLDEIMAALKEGGFDLSTISPGEDGQKRGVAITLAKNTQKFHRLPNGDFGLLSWYPGVRAKREREKSGDTGARDGQFAAAAIANGGISVDLSELADVPPADPTKIAAMPPTGAVRLEVIDDNRS